MSMVHKLSQQFTCFLLLLFPVSILFYAKAPGITFNLLLSLGVIYFTYSLFTVTGRQNIYYYVNRYKLIILSLVLPFIVDTISKLLAYNYDGLFSTSAQRLALTTFVLFWLLSSSKLKFRYFDFGIIVATLISGILFTVDSNFGATRPVNQVHNLLNYTNLIVLFGIYCLYSINFTEYELINKSFNRSIRLISFVVAGLAIVLSQSKGPILSYLVLTAFFAIRTKNLKLNKKITFGVVIIAFAFSLAAINYGPFKDRFISSFSTVQNTTSIIEGNKPSGTDGSTRIRIQLWYASILMLQEDFWFGDGSREFSDKLINLNKAGLISDEATWATKKRPFNQAHNEIFQTMSETGIFGLLSLLLLYLAPFGFFLKQTKSTTNREFPIIELGLSFCLAIVLFGLTVTIFTAPWMTAVYGIFISVYLSMLDTDG